MTVKITVPMSDGSTREVTGYPTGDRRFYVTRGSNGRWTVTHRTTGMALRPGFSWTMAEAVEAFKAAARAVPEGPAAVHAFAQDRTRQDATDTARTFVLAMRGAPVAQVPTFTDLTRAVLQDMGSDWDGDADTLTCPCGYTLEQDAEACPNGCPNPLRAAGLI